MEAKLIFSPSFPSKLRLSSPKLSILCSTVSPDNNSQASINSKPKETNSTPNLSIRYRSVRSRRQQAKQEEEEKKQKQATKPSTKKWEEMRLSEKALEIYLGEKGLLFWLNKLAYASIFAVIGGWILFRFVGPSLGFYQLDSPPLSPTSIFKDG